MTVINLYIFQSLKNQEGKKEVGTLELRGDIHSHNTRGRTDINLPFVTLSMVKQSNNVFCFKLYSHLPCTAQNLPDTKFKKGVEKLLLANPHYTVSFLHCGSLM
jgi:hypothetical protein